MNEWGIPDWRDARSYGDVKRWSINRWLWEFRRRRADLREEFDARAQLQYERDLRQFEVERERGGNTTFPFGRVLSPDEPGFYISSEKVRPGRVYTLPNPRIGDQPELVLENFDEPEVLAQHMSVGSAEGFLRIDFDLSQPLRPQIEAAEELLAAEQKEAMGKVQQRSKTRPAVWLMYLRLLDAKAAGAKWIDIAARIEHLNSVETAKRAHKRAKAWEGGR
jgi:hypothetical protein